MKPLAIGFTVAAISRDEAVRLVVAYHYMHRVPPVTHARQTKQKAWSS